MRYCLSYLDAACRYFTDLILSRSFWFGAKLMRKPSPSFLLRLEGDAASVTAEIGRLWRADLRWSPRKHGPSQVKCSSWMGSPCRGGDEQTACDTAEFQTNPTGPRKPFVGTCISGESQHAVGRRRLHARVSTGESCGKLQRKSREVCSFLS